ncbi:MAG TPA: hypothetical protein VGB55_14875, partial [Tepidisphaeraceae bacterium]
MPASPEPIPYAPHVAGRRWRRWAVRLTITLSLFAAGAGLYQQRDPISVRIGRLYWGWQCARHVVPQDTVLIESDPVKAAALLATSPDYAPQHDPTSMAKVLPSSGPIAVYAPRAWQRFAKLEPRSNRLYPPPFDQAPILFLG